MSTALIVEDEPEANRLLSLLLQLQSYRTLGVLTGTDALARLQEEVPDVVFLDLMLPDTNGYELCRYLKASPATTLIPVVVVSARLAEENRARCFQIGAMAYVPKPYTPDQLYQALRKAEEWSRQIAASPGRGSFLLNQDEDAWNRSLSRLRSLLIARGDLDSDRVARIVHCLRAIAQAGSAWSRRQDGRPAAELSYVIEPESLTIRIDDRSDWFSGGDLTEAAAGFEPGLDLVFNVVDRGDCEGQVVLIARFPRTVSS